MSEPLHPAPPEFERDHRDAPNRQQHRDRSTEQAIYRRTVEALADELAVHPLEARTILAAGARETPAGTAFEWWLP